MNEKHTPGPWVYQISNLGSAHEQGLIFPEKNGPCVAVSYEAKDARLIAAAPEMLEALMWAMHHVENVFALANRNDSEIQELESAREIIKKALGQ